jgi:hypothetical protein
MIFVSGTFDIFWLLEKFIGINEVLFQSNKLPKPAILMLL